MSTKNKNLQATAQLFHHHGSIGHWQWPTTHVTHPKMVTHLTHDPWPTDPFPSLIPLPSFRSRTLSNPVRGLEEHGLGRSPSRSRIWCILTPPPTLDTHRLLWVYTIQKSQKAHVCCLFLSCFRLQTSTADEETNWMTNNDECLEANLIGHWPGSKSAQVRNAASFSSALISPSPSESNRQKAWQPNSSTWLKFVIAQVRGTDSSHSYLYMRSTTGVTDTVRLHVVDYMSTFWDHVYTYEYFTQQVWPVFS